MPGPKPLIYFDNAATSFPKPPPVAEAMGNFLSHRAVNPGRAGFDLSIEIGRLVDQPMPAGFHTVRIGGSSLPSGVYLYELTSGESRFTKSMTLTK